MSLLVILAPYSLDSSIGADLKNMNKRDRENIQGRKETINSVRLEESCRDEEHEYKRDKERCN